MISESAYTYAKILFSRNIKAQAIQQMTQLLTDFEVLTEVLSNPCVKRQEKESVIDALFDKEITSFLKVLCENQVLPLFSQIMEAYEALVLEDKNILKAKFTYAIKPDDKELEVIKKMLIEKYKKAGVELMIEQDDSLIGGYILTVGNTEYNKSIKGALSQMQKALIGR